MIHLTHYPKMFIHLGIYWSCCHLIIDRLMNHGQTFESRRAMQQMTQCLWWSRSEFMLTLLHRNDFCITGLLWRRYSDISLTKSQWCGAYTHGTKTVTSASRVFTLWNYWENINGTTRYSWYEIKIYLLHTKQWYRNNVHADITT